VLQEAASRNNPVPETRNRERPGTSRLFRRMADNLCLAGRRIRA
jgi:hypothetical protein